MNARCHKRTLFAAAVAGVAVCIPYALLADTLAPGGRVVIESAHVTSSRFGEREEHHARRRHRRLNERFRLERRHDLPAIDIDERSRIRIDENPTIKIDEGRPLSR